jgi:probable HAF family extracellular repeat protein
MYTRTALIVSATLAASLVCSTLANAAYTVTDLGLGTAEAINDLGVIVGVGGDGGGGGYIWSNGTYGSLMPQQGATLPYAGALFSFTPKDINNNNVVAGYMYTQDGDRAFTWSNGAFLALPSLPFQTANTTLKYSRAVGINNSDQIVGSTVFPDGSAPWRATIWQSGAISSDIQWQTLAGDHPYAQWADTGGNAINDLGHVVGTSESNDGWRPFVYKDGQMTELLSSNGFDMTGVNAKDINNLGTIVGEGLGNSGFILSNGTVKLLGFEGGTTSKALSVNDSNLVVGMATIPDEFQSGHAFLFDGKDMIDLSLLPEVIASGWTELTYANDINNVGQIIGNGYINGEQHAFLLTPVSVPEPEAYAMMLAGLGLVGAVARGRRR